MIHYALRCRAGHEFDGWFQTGASFDAQAAAGQIECPVCSETHVERALMAPRLGKRMADPAPPAPPVPAPEILPPQAEAALPPMPAEVRAVLQRIRADVEKRGEYVGPNFAESARRIHEGAERERLIYGEATPAEAEALQEDGIDVARLPWVSRAES